MKFFTKIFLCTIAVVSMALSVLGYLMISNSFHNTIARENQRSLEEYQLIKFALQSGVLSASQNKVLNGEVMIGLAQQTAHLAPSGNQTAVLSGDRNVIFSNFPPSYNFSTFYDAKEHGQIYMIEKRGKEYWLVVSGKFSQSNITLYLSTARNITSIMDEKDEMQRRFIATFFIVLCISIIILLTLSLILTTPIKKLTRITRRFAQGNYAERATVKSNDEIGELSRSFNKMAKTIQDTIQQFELNAQQKEDFVANFAHELKTPLTSVIGYADMIYQRDDLTRKELRDAAAYILNEGMRLEALSLKLMELIVLGRHDFPLVEMKMDEVLQDIAATLLPVMQTKLIAFSVSSDLAYVRLEYDLFKTLLLNLIDNAIKAGGKHISLLGKIEGNCYNVIVTDDGCGIPADKLARITEAFYMIDKSRSRSQHGVGLGLAIASRIAELHGTSLKFESILEEGTRVCISLQMEKY